jgi:hypothetical protein
MALFPLGILSAAGAAGPAGPPAYDLISTTVLGSDTPSVTFDVSSLGSTYKHLQVRAVVFANGGSAFIRYNGDSTSGNYRSHGLYGHGSTVTSEDYTFARDKGMIGGGMGLSTTIPHAHVVDILDPFSTTKNTTTRSLSGRALGGVALDSFGYLSTSAITSVQVMTNAANYLTGSRFSLYGIKG